MSILVNNKSRIVVQGITGSEGQFHTKQMLEYGTNIVAGVTPGKGGQKFEDKIPILSSPIFRFSSDFGNFSLLFISILIPVDMMGFLS